MPKRIYWPKVKKIWWCLNCNIPVLQEICPRCRSRTTRIQLSDPGDARLAFERDYKSLYAAYIYEFGTSKGFNDIIGRSIALVNKAPYYDEMKEIVADGTQVGRLYFDPLLRKWRFRLSRTSAIKLYTCYPDVVETITVHKKYYKHSDIIRIDKVIEPEKQIILLDPSNNVVGLGYSKGKGKVMVHSWWGSLVTDRIVPNNDVYRKTTIDDVVKAHEEYMNILVSRAKKFIAIMNEKIDKPVIVSFSGGKDSLVSLHLVLDLGMKPIVLFNNTGIELPETISTVYNIVESYGLELIEASAQDKFWTTVNELGIPGRDYRWCCKVCKLAPLAYTVKSLWSSGGLNVVGQRAYESIDRAKSPNVWRLRWAPMLLNISPINEWSQFEVWLYIFMNKLPANPLYFMGYERIGCFMCPASTLAELELVSQTHRDLWSKWLEVLEYWAKRMNMPREWIDYGLWRWTGPARYKSMLARRLKVSDSIDNWFQSFKSMLDPDIDIVRRDDNGFEVEMVTPIDIEFLENQISILKPDQYEVDVDRNHVFIKWSNAYISLDIKGRISLTLIESSGIERLVDILKLFYRWRFCTGCRSCETICPSEAAKVSHFNGRIRPFVNRDRCIGCRFCVYNCPVAEVYVEHVVASILLNDPEAWRRESREHHEEVMEKIKEYIRKRIYGLEPRKNVENREYAEASYFFNILQNT
ncbi:MAG: phosphoadenosine phosphosulfate reductase family protein [Ignisphaera sp.]